MANNELWLTFTYKGKTGVLREEKAHCVLKDTGSNISLEGEIFPISNGNWRQALRDALAHYGCELVDVTRVYDDNEETKKIKKIIEGSEGKGSGCCILLASGIVFAAATLTISIIA
ncbi:hypothetical protein [Magnetospirillum sp. 15-1]|uniref:hypothetical protein n=1 Tax=Magnetospirillum sp. 15-1 TaxID=1979370 RepID=UPI000BBCBE8E|nr:hypothetical protein [Magnetospirillum sp. 15-1]